MLLRAGLIIVSIFLSWFAFLKKSVATLLVSLFLSKAISLPSWGNAIAIESALNPVKVPISKTFLIFDVLIIRCKKWQFN